MKVYKEGMVENRFVEMQAGFFIMKKISIFARQNH